MTALTHQQKLARNVLLGEMDRQGRPAGAGTIREATTIAASPHTAGSLAKIAGGDRKAAKRAIERAELTRLVTETLTAASTPRPPAGAGQAPAAPARPAAAAEAPSAMGLRAPRGPAAAEL